MHEVYAFQHQIGIRNRSASGGAFTAIVEAWKSKWKEQGIEEVKLAVYGAAFDEQFNIVHKRAVNDEWHEFRGSKYGVSDISNILPLILADLKSGHKVFFSGTSCQIAAVKKQIVQNGFGSPDIFYLDILCHGTPEKKVWNDYKKYIENLYGGKLINFSFRYKNTISHEPIMFAEFSNGRKVYDSMELRTYMDLYFTYMPLRKCCYSCKFSNLNRISDVTIGDFWGAENIFEGVNVYKGISQILINTVLGKSIWEIVIAGNEYDYCIKNEGNAFLQYQHNLLSPTKCPREIGDFWGFYETHSFDEVVKKYLGTGMYHRIVFVMKRIMAYIGIKEKIKRLLKR